MEPLLHSFLEANNMVFVVPIPMGYIDFDKFAQIIAIIILIPTILYITIMLFGGVLLLISKIFTICKDFFIKLIRFLK